MAYQPAQGAHLPPAHQHPLLPQAGGIAAPHYRNIPPQEQPTHNLPPVLPHQSYYPDGRTSAMTPHAIAGPAPGMRDYAPQQGQMENGHGPSTLTPTLKSEPENEGLTHRPPPSPISKSDGDRIYRLEVVQQPSRARMCGFGDKDRRPITPPPCIRLIVVDRKTGQEIDCNSIEHQMYILQVDLWNADGTKEVNLVKHSQNSPSISSTTVASFREVENRARQLQFPDNMPHSQQPGLYAGHPPAPSMPYQQPVGSYTQPGAFNGYSNQQGEFNNYDYRAQMPGNPGYPGRYPQDMAPQRNNSLAAGQQPNGMYTRNLIGSLVSSAARLEDPEAKIGIWFVLQDLSVRTEGFFRLRFSFVDVGIPGSTGDQQTSDPQQPRRGQTPVLAQCFSDVFQVFSAKKFPGVCESTALSKCFAHQGIKIPIRKEGQDGKGKDKDDDGFDNE